MAEKTEGYVHKNSKGVKYHLYTNGKLFYFAKDANKKGKGVKRIDVPKGMKVGENKKTGLPYVKKKVAKKE